MEKYRKYIMIGFILYLIYIMYGCVIHPKIAMRLKADEFAEKDIDLEEFYSEGPGVDRVAVSSDTEEGLILRCQLIDQAQESLDIAYYLIDNDESGDIFLGKVKEAADRGVKVRVLIGGVINSWTRRNVYKELALKEHPNIGFKYYGSRDLLRPWRLNNILHDKIMVIDRKWMLSSGRNISNRFFLDEGNRRATHDMDVIAYLEDERNYESSVVSQAKDYYDELWSSRYSKKPMNDRILGYEKRRAKALGVIESRYEEGIEKLKGMVDKDVLGDMNFIKVNKASLVHNSTNSVVKDPECWKTMSQFINEAEGQVTLQSPYTIINGDMDRFLDYDNIRSIDFRLWTNSLETTPNIPAYSGYLGKRDELSECMDIYEYHGSGSIHGKGLAVDDDIVMVGTCNTDPRSAFMSTENMVVANSKEFSEEFIRVMQSRLEESRLISEEDSLGESKSIKIKALIFRIASILVKPFQHLL